MNIELISAADKIAAAYDETTPAEVLIELAYDENREVRDMAMGNPSFPLHVYREIEEEINAELEGEDDDAQY